MERKILIVEDDRTIAQLVSEKLTQWGFAVRCVEDFSSVMTLFEEMQPDLVLLDISLPFYNGYYWCGEIRKVSQVPIVYLSSHTENMDIVMAMNMGGDDYITKPFAMEVLVAKVHALLRRAYQYVGELSAVTAAGITLNIADGSILAGDVQLDLTRNESKLLRTLMEKKNTVVSREELMRVLWEDEHFIDENTLTVNINRLRKKLADAGAGHAIQTKKGEGYLIRD